MFATNIEPEISKNKIQKTNSIQFQKVLILNKFQKLIVVLIIRFEICILSF